jgi:hypothetical protein
MCQSWLSPADSVFGYLEDESGDIVEKSGGAKPF